MGQLEDMAMFVRIVEAGGIGKAAEQLELAKSAVSRRLNELEKRLCTQLLTRTTRKSSLTDAGALYYERSLNILADVATLNDHASGVKGLVAGTLKMTAPLSFGLMHLTPVINEFSRQNSHVNFQIDFSDHQKDLIEEAYELAIRIGDLKDSSFQARRITAVRHVICASPEYLQQMGEPGELADLGGHRFLQYGMASQNLMQLTDSNGRQHSLQIKTKMKANNGDFLKQMAICGHGIVYLPTFLVYQEIARGELVPILSQYRLPVLHAHAVYPKNRFLSQRCRLLIDFIAEYFGDEPYWDQ
jgi:DNA-binding transcriptional LysR family regulator